jgi:glycosyltransferase involved in cell wall biosynthesis
VSVIKTGFVPDEDLPVLYRNASAFVSLPTFEGFGLPPVEAMASGVPVVVSDTAAIREAVADAGLYVDPGDVQQVSDGLFRLLTEEGLRKAHISRGLDRASQFTWTRSAERMLSVLREAQ